MLIKVLLRLERGVFFLNFTKAYLEPSLRYSCSAALSVSNFIPPSYSDGQTFNGTLFGICQTPTPRPITPFPSRPPVSGSGSLLTEEETLAVAVSGGIGGVLLAAFVVWVAYLRPRSLNDNPPTGNGQSLDKYVI